MKILIVTAELAPIAAAGGVAQYIVGLARALSQNEHEVHVAIPNYGFLPEKNPELLDGITVHRLSEDPHFLRAANTRGIYTADSFLPWADFCRSTVDFLLSSELRPDVVHCQDGHASLVPVYIDFERQSNPDKFGGLRTVITIHNLLEQGKESRDFFDSLALPSELFDTHFEFYGEVNCYKAGLMFADRVSTVSRTYASEIVSSEEFGFGLSGVLNALDIPPAGVVNGIDGTIWRLQEVKYDGSDNTEGIVRQKRAILPELLPGWSPESNDPILAFKARWDRQKGIGLLVENMEEILEQARFVFDTWGQPKDSSGPYYEVWETLLALRDKYPLRLAVNVPGTTSATESAALYTLADFLVMPSVYEPCGLAQMECQRYGCIPIVRRTGGLADTVTDVSSESQRSNGIVFNTMTHLGLLSGVKRAVRVYRDRQTMQELVGNAIAQKNEWHHRVAEYEELYRDANA